MSRLPKHAKSFSFDPLADWSAFAGPLPRHDALAYCYEELSFAGMRYIHDPAPIALDASVSSPELPSSPRELKPATSRANHFPLCIKLALCVFLLPLIPRHN